MKNSLQGNKRRVAKHWREKMAVIHAVKHERGCCICRESDPIVLEFHHKEKSTKHKFLIKRNHSGSFHHLNWTDLFKEIDKCDVMCANCHRRKEYMLRRQNR